jgi:putative protease
MFPMSQSCAKSCFFKGDSMFIPELLSPAGSLDKLKVAVSYGANAVYLGGQKFGLRSAADNFTYKELEEGVEYAHSHQAKVYVVLNSFLHDKDLDELPEFVEFLDRIGVDAVIVSDLGVIKTVIKHSSIDVHLSTQASCLNVQAAKLWKKMGVTRVVLGREVSIKDAGKIKKEAAIEVEMFVHGSMCMAYSGNCVISNFTQGRDSNRGGCAHSCRFEYSIDFKNEEEKKRAFFMSSKDLNGLRVLQEYIDHEIDSIKVEGRMKSHLYAGTISKVYSEALNYYREHGNFLSDDLQKWEEELKKVTHRSYTAASLIEPAQKDSIFNEREVDSSNDYIMVGRILDIIVNKSMVLEVRNAFNLGDTVEILPFKGDVQHFKFDEIQTLTNEKIERTKPSTLVKMPYLEGITTNNIVRMKAQRLS